MTANHSKLSPKDFEDLGECKNYVTSDFIGNNCQSLCTTVAQLYEANNSRWVIKYAGILCFIKDRSKKSYFMRMYCLRSLKTLWEHEIYNELEIDRVRPFLLEFEGQVGFVK
jgi:neural Wiskott-Aldrich syndrome protein